MSSDEIEQGSRCVLVPPRTVMLRPSDWRGTIWYCLDALVTVQPHDRHHVRYPKMHP